MTNGRTARYSFLKNAWNFSSSSSRSVYKWLNISKYGLFTFVGSTHMFRLLRRYHILNIIVCKTSMLKFSIALEFFTCALFQRVLKTHWDSRRLDWTRLDRCDHPLTLESDWTGLDSTRLCWCVRTLSGVHIPTIVGHGKHTSTSLWYVSHYLVTVSAVDICRASHVSYLQ